MQLDKGKIKAIALGAAGNDSDFTLIKSVCAKEANETNLQPDDYC